MKNFIIILCAFLLIGCSRNDNLNNCNFLLDVGVNINVNLNLPQFSQLQNTGNSVRINGQGNAGIIVTRVNSSTIRAWDGADPNHPVSGCSTLTIDGVNAVCGCDDANVYNLLTGQSLGENQQPCTLRAYRVDAVGNNQFLVTN
ncbi:hypothetical protein ACFQ1Q_06605 [Winogradskyella litorisediminis]|uniref:Ferredoxin subunit of nitrite reductase or a ring-hydroxylating dioxygenase n=1 Tax=Winogradskyella litorisediminis TaxID=1156618 RepID=A0ABW3N5C9_9FLAO